MVREFLCRDTKKGEKYIHKINFKYSYKEIKKLVQGGYLQLIQSKQEGDLVERWCFKLEA